MAFGFQSNAFQFGAFQQSDPQSGQTVLTKGKAGHSGASFTRRRFDELRAAQRAQDELELKAQEAKRAKEQVALKRAAQVAQEAIDLTRESEAADTERIAAMTNALDAAIQAKTLSDTLRSARQVELQAKAIIAEIDDEEEAITLLLH